MGKRGSSVAGDKPRESSRHAAQQFVAADHPKRHLICIRKLVPLAWPLNSDVGSISTEKSSSRSTVRIPSVERLLWSGGYDSCGSKAPVGGRGLIR